jgi:cytochrome c-type biogenesis protein CcmH/NrfG
LRISVPVQRQSARPASPAPKTPIPQSRDWLVEGNLAYERRNYEEARWAYEMAIKADQHSVDAWSGLGTTLFHLGRAEDALLAYDQAIALRGDDPELWRRCSVMIRH